MMRIVLLGALIVVCTAAVLPAFHTEFQSWKLENSRQYVDAREEMHRLDCFQKNMATIARLNAKDTAVHGLNQFSDLCASEFKTMYHNAVFPKTTDFELAPPLTAADRLKDNSTSYDWRQHGAVTAVKNQGQCGSCWTFSAIGAIEGAWFLGGQTLTQFSEEQIVQCATSAGQGCQGGNMRPAIQYVIDNGGVNTEVGYPYTSGNGVTGTCNSAKAAVKVGKVSKYLAIPYMNEADLQVYLLKYGPLAIGVDANDGWQTYKSGIKSSCTWLVQIDHGVTLVGYGVEGSTKYWIIKNSWAANWGESGYIRMKRGVDCDGIAMQATAAQY
jgi:cathepsin F/cysteine peptidase B